MNFLQNEGRYHQLSVSGDITGNLATDGLPVGADITGNLATDGLSVSGDIAGNLATDGLPVSGDMGGNLATDGLSVSGDIAGKIDNPSVTSVTKSVAPSPATATYPQNSHILYKILQWQVYNQGDNTIKECKYNPLLPSTAYLLVSHGSRDPRPGLAMEKLAELVRSRLGEGKKAKDISSYLPFFPSSGWGNGQLSLYSRNVGTAIAISNAWTPLVETATLELGNCPLNEQIRLFAHKALAYSYHQIQVLPLFLLRGVHVMEDIPQAIAIAQQHITDIVEIQQLPHLGSHPHLGQLLINQEDIADVEAKILVSHGTRRVGGNQSVETIAQNLEAVAAYWSVEPMLPQQIKNLASKGYEEIGILPYFLFSGSITDAIGKTITNLQQQFPQLHIKQGQPIGATPQLAELIVDLIEKS